MNIPTLSHLSHEELLTTVKTLREKERLAIADMVLYLSEVDSRGIYRDYGYSSLFAYCVSVLKYSESGAWRRIAAARCLRDNPEIYDKLKSGSMSLCTIAELSKVLTVENKEALILASEGRSKREVERMTSQFKTPEASIKRDRIVAKRVVVEFAPDLFSQAFDSADSPTKSESLPPVEVEASFSFRFEADGEFMKLYEETRALMGGAPTMAEVFSRALKMYRRVKSPIERAKRREQRRTMVLRPKPVAPRTRHIPVLVQDQVFNRDRGQCSFIAPDGHRCTETHGLQLDHIEPYSLGGKHSEDNLRLLCHAHNRLFAERVFGRATMESHVGRG